MPRAYTQLTFTEDVRAVQQEYGTRASAAKVENWSVDDRHLSDREISFVSKLDGFYMATVGQDGWPYVQFRGGPPGFVKILSESQIGFADFRGNLQYVSVGNIRGNDRVALIMLDYPSRHRLKIMARARVLDATEEPDLVAKLAVPGYGAVIERAVLLDIEGFDWNCRQHITPRYTAEEWKQLAAAEAARFATV